MTRAWAKGRLCDLTAICCIFPLQAALHAQYGWGPLPGSTQPVAIEDKQNRRPRNAGVVKEVPVSAIRRPLASTRSNNQEKVGDRVYYTNIAGFLLQKRCVRVPHHARPCITHLRPPQLNANFMPVGWVCRCKHCQLQSLKLDCKNLLMCWMWMDNFMGFQDATGTFLSEAGEPITEEVLQNKLSLGCQAWRPTMCVSLFVF